MKLTILLALVCMFQVSASISTNGQNVSLKINELPLKEVFKTLESLSNYRFFYNEAFADLYKPVSCDVTNKPINEVLDNLFQGSRVYYKVLENNLVVIAPVSELQRQNITGRVTDASTGEPLPGVNIYLKGTTQGVVSDVDGKYSLEVDNPMATLVFSYVGYNSQEVLIQNKAQINVALVANVKALEEVIVVGYGTQKKLEVTSAVSSVKNNDFIQGSVKDAAQLIQGKVAGLSITSPSGNPVEGTQVMLRGISTISGDQSPLVLIDGIPGSLSTVAPNDIESIDVLKDGSAAAIYGTRGSNGVILITTKKVKTESIATIEYNAYLSTQSFLKKADFLTADDYHLLNAQGKSLTDYGYSTNWLKEITRTPISYEHNLSMKGGNSSTNYIASITYKNLEGTLINSDRNTINSRVDVNHMMFNGKLKANLNMLGTFNKYTSTADGGSFNVNAYRQALIRNPTDRIKDDNGVWVENTGYFQYENPVAMLNETDGLNKDKEIRVSGSLAYSPVKSFNMKVLISTTNWDEMRGYSETKRHISNIRDKKNGFASRGESASSENLLEFTTDYYKLIGKHSFKALAGYSYQDKYNEGFWMNNYDFPTDFFSYNNLATGNALKAGNAEESSYKNMSKLIGFFGRLNYNFDEKYLLMASIRHEGSSKFGKNHKWGNFPSISAGWRVSEEAFLKDISFVNDFKIRVGYGITGNTPNDPYRSLTLLRYGDSFLANGVWIQGLGPNSNPNPDLRWEKKAEVNIGLDFSVMQNRISGSLDYYKRKTTDLLYNYTVPVPPNLVPNMLANAATMENKGIEALLEVTPLKTNNFQWVSTISFSRNTNKLVSLSDDIYKASTDFIESGYTGDPIQQATHRSYIGGPIGDFWGLKSVDIDPTGQWIIEGADGNPKSVLEKKTEDRKKLGNGIPQSYAGFNNSFRYKNLELGITMRGAFGFQILNFQRMFYENPTIAYNKLASAYDKVYNKAVLNSTQEYVSYYIEDGDYWKIDNITLAYTFNSSGSKLFKSARIYVSGLNMFTFTKYKGLDPEVNRFGLAPGNDERDKYPTSRIFSFGVNIIL